jgi:hypothetical protein
MKCAQQFVAVATRNVLILESSAHCYIIYTSRMVLIHNINNYILKSTTGSEADICHQKQNKLRIWVKNEYLTNNSSLIRCAGCNSTSSQEDANGIRCYRHRSGSFQPQIIGSPYCNKSTSLKMICKPGSSVVEVKYYILLLYYIQLEDEASNLHF